MRIIRVVVQVGGVKIYVAEMEALRINERHGETQFTTKIVRKISLGQLIGERKTTWKLNHMVVINVFFF